MRKTNIILTFIFCSFLVFCQKFNINNKTQFSSNLITGNKNDSVITPKSNMVFLIYPDKKTIDSLKRHLGEDFYTIADDANYYNAQIMEYLDSLHVPYVNIDDSVQIILKKENNVDKVIKKGENTYWYAVLYKIKTHSFIISNLADFQANYSDFYNNTQ